MAELIKVREGAKIFPPKGKILFTTVSLAGDVNVFEALAGWVDDEVEVIPEKQITGGAPRTEVRQQNIQAMVDSKLTATKVALERLGYRVSVTGDGGLVTALNAGDPADGHLQVGDVIKTIDGEPVTLHDQVVSKVRQHKPGDVIATIKIGNDAIVDPSRDRIKDLLNKAGQDDKPVDMVVVRQGKEQTVTGLTPNLNIERGKKGLGIGLGYAEAEAVVAAVASDSPAGAAGVTPSRNSPAPEISFKTARSSSRISAIF